jgi:fumarylacetoacetase
VSGFGIFSRGGGAPRVGWLRGDRVLDLHAAGLGDAFAEPSLNRLMAQGRGAWESALERIGALGDDAPAFASSEVVLHLPFEVADYVDFYSSIEHATNVGRIFRPNAEPLLRNWRWLPIGYHGRAGTVVVSGTDVVRPCGQTLEAGATTPTFGPSGRLDVELELGFVVGVPSRGAVSPAAFAEHVFGVVLLNDWSARDIQAWEYQPLGPFLGKSFQTSISAWVTPLALLEPARVQAPLQDPPPLAHLDGGRDWGLDLELQIELNGEVVSSGNARTLYWTMPQQLVHATSNGAWLRTGDLMGTGTISGPARGSEGSLLELTRNGAEPLRLRDGSTRAFLEDGDEVVLGARAGTVTLGEVRGRVLSAAVDGEAQPRLSRSPARKAR